MTGIRSITEASRDISITRRPARSKQPLLREATRASGSTGSVCFSRLFRLQPVLLYNLTLILGTLDDKGPVPVAIEVFLAHVEAITDDLVFGVKQRLLERIMQQPNQRLWHAFRA